MEDETISTIEKYVCELYGRKKQDKVNDARIQVFTDKYNKKNLNERLELVKKFDGSLIPPCKKVLLKKIERTCFVARRWRAATRSQEPTKSATESGWDLSDNYYEVKWFDGEATPKLLDVVVEDGEEVEFDDTDKGFS